MRTTVTSILESGCIHSLKNSGTCSLQQAKRQCQCALCSRYSHSGLQPHQHLGGIVVGIGPNDSLPPEIQAFQGSLPPPNQVSRDAAEAVMRMLRPFDEDDLVLFRISGRASSMLEAPLDSSIPSEEVQEFYGILVHSGLSITDVNTLRKHLSVVKGGRLANYASPLYGIQH